MNPLWFSEVTPLTHQQVETSSQRETLMTWEGGVLCVSGPGRDFRLLFPTPRALGRQRPVLSPHIPLGGVQRGGARHAENSLPVLF